MFSRKPEAPRPGAYTDQLASIPLRNERVRSIAETEESLTLELDLRYHGSSGFLARLLRARTNRRVLLDGLSLEIYRAVDGRRSAAAIIDHIAKRWQLSFMESRGLVVYYIQELTRRGLLVLRIDPTDP